MGRLRKMLIKTLNTIKIIIEWFENYILKIFPVVLIILTIAAVFNRYFLYSAMSWNEEISLYIMMLIVFWGIIHAARNDKHFRLYFLLDRLKEKDQKYLETLLLFICFFISLLGVYFGIKIVSIINSKTVILKIPHSIIISSTMVMGFIGMSIEYLFKILKKIK